MKLYLIWQDQRTGYDTYDSVVVAAETPTLAGETSPDNYRHWSRREEKWFFGEKGLDMDFSAWAKHPVHVSVEYLGPAKRGTKAGVICASFNAG